MTDKIEAGDATFAHPTLDALRLLHADLADEYRCKEMSDDFAFTNGSLSRIRTAMAEVAWQIKARLADMAAADLVEGRS